MSNIKRGDLVTLIHYTDVIVSTMDRPTVLEIRVREAEVEKCGKKTMNINGYQFYHEDVEKGIAKSGRCYNTKVLVVPNTDKDCICEAVKEVKALMLNQLSKLVGTLEERLLHFKECDNIDVVYKD